jgi:Ca2+-binding RTX toxin-like protein
MLSGGDGYDIAGYGAAAAAVSIDLSHASTTWSGEALGDTLVSIEEIDLTNFADIFRGDSNSNIAYGGGGDDQINGLAGDDQLFGGRGNDSVYGGDGNDLVVGDGGFGSGDDYLQGNAGDDILVGGGGNDKLVGGVGNDKLSGGVGGDILIGNEGADTFQFAAIEESQNTVLSGVKQQDQIIDFAQGEDKVDLSAIDASSTLSGDQAFTLLTDPTHYSGDWSGLVWETTSNGVTTINVSTDADSASEMQISMTHAYHFATSDFLL